MPEMNVNGSKLWRGVAAAVITLLVSVLGYYVHLNDERWRENAARWRESEHWQREHEAFARDQIVDVQTRLA